MKTEILLENLEREMQKHYEVKEAMYHYTTIPKHRYFIARNSQTRVREMLENKLKLYEK